MKTGKIFSGELATVNSILPHRNRWAWELFLKGQANNWVPSAVSMAKDIEQWRGRSALSDDERLLLKRCLGFFAGSESLVGNNLLIGIFRAVGDAECRQYILRQAFEEALHNQTVVYVCDSLGLEVAEIYEAYRNVPSIKAKDDFLMGVTTDMGRPGFDATTPEGKREALRNIIAFYLICEGVFFYSGFAMLLSFGRQGKMPGIAEQIQYTLRDECVSEDTELLTRKGWVKVGEIGDSEIAQYHEDGHVSFARPVRRSVSVANHLYRFSNHEGHLDLLVSPNHRMVKVKKSGGLKIEPAELASYHPYSKHLLAGVKLGGSKHKLTPEERFRIAFQADGCRPNGEHRNGNHCGYVRVRVQIKKPRKITRLREILSLCGYDYREELLEDGRTTFVVDAPPQTISKKLNWVDLGAVTAEWCADFISELQEWDGHVPADGRVTWGCVDPENADAVQAVCALAGYRTCRTLVEDNRSETYQDYHRVHICKDKDYIRGGTIVKEKVDGPAKVYGVEVPTGMIIVRRNGAVAVTGNSVHLQFGTLLANAVIEQEPEIWTDDFRAETIGHFQRATELEIAYAKDVMPRGVLGMNAELFVEYMRFVANRRLNSIGFADLFPGARNPFPWMSEAVDLNKHKNFFETRVTNYSVGQLADDLD